MNMDQNKNNAPDHNSTEIITWVITIILLIAIWPIGLIMLIRKLAGGDHKSKNAPSGSGPVKEARTSAPPKADFKSPLEKKSGRFASVMLLLVSIALFIIGVNRLIAVAQHLPSSIGYVLSTLLVGAFFIIGGFVVFFSRNILSARLARYKKYYAFSKGRDIVLIPHLARTAGLSERAVLRDLSAMINARYFPSHAYIDIELSCLILNAEAADATRDAAKSGFESEDDGEAAENQYMTILAELRKIHGMITDAVISKKVTEIEDLTAKIFRIVEENPVKLPQIRRFMSYYLPTTLKLLKSYATLEKQGIKGENITAAKENIGRILDTLVNGYEKQLDQLFKSDMIDLSADINVLENMMQQDGLSK